MKMTVFPKLQLSWQVLPGLCLSAAITLVSHAQSPGTDSFFNPSAGGPIYAMAMQADGKIVVGGSFNRLGAEIRDYLGRLNADGTLDAAFNRGADNSIYSLAVQADDKVLVGGSFTTLGGQTRYSIGRLNADGTLDTTFNPGAGGEVKCLLVQPDGRILAGGSFTSLGGQPRNYIGRLNADGTLDTSFNPGANGSVFSLALQENGKIVVGGSFNVLGGQVRTNLGRLNANGTVDTTFNQGANGTVECLAVQADGKILVGGYFNALAGQGRTNIGRFNADGTLDTGFNAVARGTSTYPVKLGVTTLAIQADGKILVGGDFTVIGATNPVPRYRFGRLNADGNSDFTFTISAYLQLNGPVFCLVVQPDGKILVGGSFTSPPLLSYLFRLNSTGPAAQTLAFDGSTLTWLRGGTGPEIGRASFEASTNGTDWFGLGEGMRIAGGWQLSDVSVPTEATIRARGSVAGGYAGGSSWFAQAGVGPLLITSQPADQTRSTGTTAAFSVATLGTEPLTYQWRKEGAPLVDDGRIVGVTNSALMVSKVVMADSGGYSVAISNSHGMVTSRVASLTVVDTVIASQPVSVQTNLGATAAFRVTATGTPPLSYQWRRDGVVLAGATDSALTLANVQQTDRGNYEVVVGNPFGSLISKAATLTLTPTADSFNPGAMGGYAESLAVQPDGKILTGGLFERLGGQMRRYIGRLNPDGTLDTAFNPNPNHCVNCMALQPDGKLVLGGVFSTPRYIFRVNADGSRDIGFYADTAYWLNSLALQPDGKIVIGGESVQRLNRDGTRDNSFNSSIGGYYSLVCSLALQPDGKIIVGGVFTSLGGQARTNIGRLNANGTVDTTFNSEASGQINTSRESSVITLAVQPDGKILAGGNFTSLGGQYHYGLGRLNPNGTLDLGFNARANYVVHTVALQADGKILVGESGIFRLNADGTEDASFGRATSSTETLALALQTDGKILVGGTFNKLAGLARTNLGRLFNTDPAADKLDFDGSTITWLRGGTSPEAWRTTFDYSTDGTNWNSLGAGMRMVGGWQRNPVSVPATVTLRARGFVTGGHYNASGSFVETLASFSPPVILTQPVSQTNNVGTAAVFSVEAGGTPPLDYQWRKDGTNLDDATTSTLTLTNVQESDQGCYSVVVSNAFGWIASSDVMLVVNQAPIADASATKLAVILANGTNATVILDGTRSSDPDGDLLQYLWLSTINSQPSTLLASGVVAVVVLPLGAHPILLVVSDGVLAATNGVTVEVITTVQAVERLMAQVTLSWPRSRPLVATLSAALRSIERGNLVSALNQLRAFQNKVRAQVTPSDPALAATVIQAAQDIIDVLSGGNTNPRGRPHGRFTAVGHQANGRAQVQFSAERGLTYVVEASTNLVDWEMIGVAVDHGDGTFDFEDSNAARFPSRYYRLVSP